MSSSPTTGAGSSTGEHDQDIILEEVDGETEPRRREKARKKQFRFFTYHDLTIIQEVQHLQPFMERGKASTDIWKSISNMFNNQYGCDVTPLSLQRRFTLLLNEFRKEDFLNRYKSGKEEEKTEIKERLADIASLIADKRAEENLEKQQKAKEVDKEKEAAEEIKNAAASTFKRKGENDIDDSPKTSLPKRTTEKGLLDLWKQKQEADLERQSELMERDSQEKQLDRELRREELQIERDKLILEKQRMEHEKEKQAADAKLQQERFELEKEERKMMLKTQQALLDLLKRNST